MTFHDYLRRNLENTAMIHLDTGDDIFEYNYWNWFHQRFELHLLKDDYTIGHILHDGIVSDDDNGVVMFYSKYHPYKLILNFYFSETPKGRTTV